MFQIAAKCLVPLSVILAFAASPVLADDAKFAGPTFNSDVGFDIGISQDKKAFTALFSGLVASIDGVSAAPIVTRTVSFILPLSGAAPGTEIPFFVSGAVITKKAANGHLIVTLNEQTTAVDFPPETDKSFIQTIKYKVGYSPEVRITVFLVADRDSKSDGAVNLTVSAIDTDLAKHQN